MHPAPLLLGCLLLALAGRPASGGAPLLGCVVELPLYEDATGVLRVRVRLGLGAPPSTSLRGESAPVGTDGAASSAGGPVTSHFLHLRLSHAAPSRHVLQASPAALSRTAYEAAPATATSAAVWRDYVLYQNGLDVARLEIDPLLSSIGYFSLGANSSIWNRFVRAEVCLPRLRVYLLTRHPDCPTNTPLQCPPRMAGIAHAPLAYFAAGTDQLVLDGRATSFVATAGGGGRTTAPFLDTAAYSGPATVMMVLVCLGAVMMLLPPWWVVQLAPMRMAIEMGLVLMLQGLGVMLLEHAPFEARVRGWAPVDTDPHGDAAYALVRAPLEGWVRATLPVLFALVNTVAVAVVAHAQTAAQQKGGVVDYHVRVERRLLVVTALLLPVQVLLIPNPQHLNLFFIGVSTYLYLLLRAWELTTSLGVYHWRLRARVPLPLQVAGVGVALYAGAALTISSIGFVRYTLYPGMLANMRLVPMTASVLATLLVVLAVASAAFQTYQLWWIDPATLEAAAAERSLSLADRIQERNAIPDSSPNMIRDRLASVLTIIYLTRSREASEWLNDNLLFGIILFAFIFVVRRPLLNVVRALKRRRWHSASNAFATAIQLTDASLKGVYVAGTLNILPQEFKFDVLTIIRLGTLAMSVLYVLAIGRHTAFDDPLVERRWVPAAARRGHNPFFPAAATPKA